MAKNPYQRSQAHQLTRLVTWNPPPPTSVAKMAMDMIRSYWYDVCPARRVESYNYAYLHTYTSTHVYKIHARTCVCIYLASPPGIDRVGVVCGCPRFQDRPWKRACLVSFVFYWYLYWMICRSICRLWSWLWIMVVGVFVLWRNCG